MVPVPAVRWKLPLQPPDRGVQDRGVQGLNEVWVVKMVSLKCFGNGFFPQYNPKYEFLVTISTKSKHLKPKMPHKNWDKNQPNVGKINPMLPVL